MGHDSGTRTERVIGHQTSDAALPKNPEKPRSFWASELSAQEPLAAILGCCPRWLSLSRPTLFGLVALIEVCVGVGCQYGFAAVTFDAKFIDKSARMATAENIQVIKTPIDNGRRSGNLKLAAINSPNCSSEIGDSERGSSRDRGENGLVVNVNESADGQYQRNKRAVEDGTVFIAILACAGAIVWWVTCFKS